MPGPGPYGNKVPPNMKRVRKVAGRYARINTAIRKMSQDKGSSLIPGPPGFVNDGPLPPGVKNWNQYRRRSKRAVVDNIIDRGRGAKDSEAWQSELRDYKRLTRRSRQYLKELKNRPPFGDAPTRPL